MPKTRVLVVEDDAAIRKGLVDALTFAGHEVMDCEDGRGGLKLAIAADLDLVILDVVLPGIDGFEILQELRRTRPTLPVILVTARGAEDDRVNGLRSGADDYVVKPFSARELLARVDAVIRRSPSREAPAMSLTLDDREVHLDAGEVRRCGTVIHLSEKEQAILRYLASAGGRIVTRDALLENVWGLDPRGITTRTVDMHIARLREKLGEKDEVPFVVTVRSRGYQLSPRVETRSE